MICNIYNDKLQVFVLNFRGLSFYFPIDSKFHPGYAHGLGSLQFPNGTSPLVAKTAIYVGNILAGGSGEEHGSKTPPPPLPLVSRLGLFCHYLKINLNVEHLMYL